MNARGVLYILQLMEQASYTLKSEVNISLYVTCELRINYSIHGVVLICEYYSTFMTEF